MTFIKKFVKNNKAATAIEYGLIAVAAIAAMGSLGNTLSNTFNTVSDEMATA